MESVLEEIDRLGSRLGHGHPEVGKLQGELVDWGLEVEKSQRHIQKLLDGSLEAYYRAYLLQEMRDLDTATKVNRLTQRDFPLRSHLHLRYQSRLALDKQMGLRPDSIPTMKNIGAFENRQQFDQTNYEC